MRTLPTVLLLLALSLATLPAWAGPSAPPILEAIPEVPAHLAALHASPTTVVQTFFRGFKEDNFVLIVESMAPETRLKLPAAMPPEDKRGHDEHMLKHWGVTPAQLDLAKIVVKILQNRRPIEDPDFAALPDGTTLDFDTLYNNRSIGDEGTLIKLNGLWYIKWF